ncbi:MAG: tetraacyldisaccharide 4'-kinase [Roseobacter sp.]|jgi:tetraacyldisaccharide 4'-kinase|nr:tetraacyldisaccharide 4'-kinase [Roseobacter sp.]
MRAPDFWFRPADHPGLRARALAPLGWLYANATARRVAQPPDTRLDVPVVCVGNLNAGGTGKTPTVIAVLAELTAMFRQPHVVTRGYGGDMKGPVRVDPARHTAADVGDEPLLLAAFANVWVAEDRAAGGRSAAEAGATAIVLDDGFQNPALRKDFSFVVVDARQGFGNGLCLPAGPLREPVAKGLARADALISIGDQTAQNAFSETFTNPGLPHLRAALEPLQTGMNWTGTKVYAFAGIGQPAKFFDTLKRLGADVVHAEPLDDHQPLTQKLVSRLEGDARRMHAQLVTTEKDAVRLPQNMRTKVMTLPVRLTFEDGGAELRSLLAPLFEK